jgi:nicotinate-nucleotide adenylyltransferase
MRVGILGGTFDPPHNGHLAMAKAAIAQLQLDDFMFLPANRNPLKTRDQSAPAKTRLEMTRLAVQNDAAFAVSDIDITRGGPSYAVDTLAELQMVRPADYWLIMGADTLKGLPMWKNPERLVKLCRIGVITRPPLKLPSVLMQLPETIRAAVDQIAMDAVPISSSEIRHLVSERHDVSTMVPRAVLSYIQGNRLYQN